jgi:hypothetical protein
MGKKYDDDDDDDIPSVRKKEPLSGLDGFFANTSTVVLVIFAFCCGGIALILSIIGVIICKDETAKSNARLVLIISGIITALSVIANVMNSMGGMGGR